MSSGTMYPEVNIFDSTYSSFFTQSKVQVASLLVTKEPDILLNYIDIQRQLGIVTLAFLQLHMPQLVKYEQLEQLAFAQNAMRGTPAQLIRARLHNQVASHEDQTGYYMSKTEEKESHAFLNSISLALYVLLLISMMYHNRMYSTILLYLYITGSKHANTDQNY